MQWAGGEGKSLTDDVREVRVSDLAKSKSHAQPECSQYRRRTRRQAVGVCAARKRSKTYLRHLAKALEVAGAVLLVDVLLARLSPHDLARACHMVPLGCGLRSNNRRNASMLLYLDCRINNARPAFDLVHSTVRQQPRSYELPSHPKAGLDWPAARLDVWLPL